MIPNRTIAAPTISNHLWVVVIMPEGGRVDDQVMVNIWLAPEIASNTVSARNACIGPHQEAPTVSTNMAQPTAKRAKKRAPRKAARAML